MRISTIDDHVLRMFVGIKSEGGRVNAQQVREIVGRMAADLPANVEIAGFLDLEDIPQERRSQFLQVLDTVSQQPR